MKTAMTVLFGGAAMALVLSALPAAAEDKASIEPNKLTVEVRRPPLQLDERQHAIIQDALAGEQTQQKIPDTFQPKVGDTIPLTMTVDVMPQALVAREPSLEPYGYAKLAKELLVLDPMKKTIVAIIPRKFPASGKSPTAVDWATTRGGEMTGQAPDNARPPTPAGDSGDKANGSEQNANVKQNADVK